MDSPTTSLRSKRTYRLLALLAMVLIVLGSVLLFAFLEVHWLQRPPGYALKPQEPDRIVRAGDFSDFRTAGIYDQRKNDGVWLVCLPVRKLIAVHTFCTHDGCATNLSTRHQKFACPCCGSEYDSDGVILSGPAQQPLSRFEIFAEQTSVMVNTSTQYRESQWGQPRASLDVAEPAAK